VVLFHVCARTAEQACDKAERYGRPVGARKIERDKIFGDIETLELKQTPLVDVYAEGNPYNSALAMDEMIWQKRNERRKNQEKDRQTA
jgi:hypothetical protein